MAIKNRKLVEDFEFCIKHSNVKDHLLEYKCPCCNKNYQNMFDKNFQKRLLFYTILLIIISVNLFYCCKKVLTHINTRMIKKNLTKYCYQRNKMLQLLKHDRNYSCRLHSRKKNSSRFLNKNFR